jgi:hypothetical protein
VLLPLLLPPPLSLMQRPLPLLLQWLSWSQLHTYSAAWDTGVHPPACCAAAVPAGLLLL